MAQAGSTHDVRLDPGRGVVVKRFRSCLRREPEREWAALRLLAESAPGLAPAPLHADLCADPAAIEMSFLPGDPLTGKRPTPPQLAALVEALERLWRCTPPRDRFPGDAPPNSAALTGHVRSMVAACPDLGDDPAARRSFAAAVAWLEGADPGRYPAEQLPILGQGDANFANFLWDGERVRLVDFEDCGPSDRGFELAILVEHLSAWSDTCLDADAFLARFELTAAEQARVRTCRRLAALFWLVMLRPGGSASARNPPGTLQRQARRLLELLD
ncbi:MAG TPA: phosphotransferase [Streptosporangiaceae bacterium]|jgi:Ser/Thr protein kinase RdoA (MazF antagonist)